MEDFLREHLWAGTILWAALYISDYALTIACARMYQAGVNKFIVFDGSYELTPYYQQDVDSLRKVSPRFLFALIASIVLLSVAWWFARQPDMNFGFYILILGMIVLMEAVVHVRHVRNFVLFRAILAPNSGIRGRIEYPRPVVLQLSAAEVLSFAVLYLLIFVATQSWFVLGGVISCLILAIQHWRLAQRAARSDGTPA